MYEGEDGRKLTSTYFALYSSDKWANEQKERSHGVEVLEPKP